MQIIHLSKWINMKHFLMFTLFIHFYYCFKERKTDYTWCVTCRDILISMLQVIQKKQQFINDCKSFSLSSCIIIY